MGTRHLIAVQYEGEYKVAQYGQWDGYPEGQGVDILKFLESADINNFKEQLKKVRFLDKEKRDKEFLENYNKAAPTWSNEPDNRTTEQKRWWDKFQSRDLGAEILGNIYESEDDEITLYNHIDFANESLHCEWAYIIDLDKNMLEIYEGLNHEPTDKNSRFYVEKPEEVCESKYYAVKLKKSYPLDNLPDEDTFVSDCDSQEDEDMEEN